jgi:hypothetical protein
MVSLEEFKNNGYLYDSLENYLDLIDFNKLVELKSFIDSKNIKRHSQYDYWYTYNNLSYAEKIVYDDLLIRDADLETADYVYKMAHQYQLKKINECKFNPTWVFGTARDPDIDVIIRSDFLKEFQTKFIKHYYTQYGDKIFEGNTNLQFYDEGCQIKLHDDGKPISRICVFLFFLNSEWNDENGGNLILYTKDNTQIKLKPTFPNFVVLDSDINLYHEVELVKSDTKYNIVSFYSYKD